MKNFIFKTLTFLLVVYLNFGLTNAQTKLYYSCCTPNGICDLIEYDTKTQCNSSCPGHSSCALNTREVNRNQQRPIRVLNQLVTDNVSGERRPLTINLE